VEDPSFEFWVKVFKKVKELAVAFPLYLLFIVCRKFQWTRKEEGGRRRRKEKEKGYFPSVFGFATPMWR